MSIQLIIYSHTGTLILEDMVVESDVRSKVQGKVLLYSTRDVHASPVMTMMQDVGLGLPVVLDKLAAKYSPIRSKLPTTLTTESNYL
jgi:hypothetical protein